MCRKTTRLECDTEVGLPGMVRSPAANAPSVIWHDGPYFCGSSLGIPAMRSSMTSCAAVRQSWLLFSRRTLYRNVMSHFCIRFMIWESEPVFAAPTRRSPTVMARFGDCFRIIGALPSVIPASPLPGRVTGPAGTATSDHVREAPEELGRVTISCLFSSLWPWRTHGLLGHRRLQAG